jgi:type I restriction enzyme, S subunit
MNHLKQWSRVQLYTACTKIGSGSTPRGGDSVYLDTGTAFIRSQNVYNGKFSAGGLAHLTEKHAEQLNGVTVKSRDVLLNITGDSVARCCLVPEWVLPARVNQHVAIVRPDSSKLLPEFLCYYFVSPIMQKYLLSRAGSGGTRNALTKGMIESLDVPCPSIASQQRVVDLLKNYDDLIENNRRRIQLLEQAVRLLYKEWFVHLRFPGHEHIKIKEGVPDGWKKMPFSDVVDFKEGPGLRIHQYRDQGIPFLNIRTFNDDEIDMSKTKCIDEREVTSKYQHFLLDEDDQVVSSSGTLGRVVTIRKSHLPVMLNTSLIRMRPKGVMRKWFLKAYLKYGDFIDQAKAMATGAAQLNYGPVHLKVMSILVPDNKLINLFEGHVSANYTQIKLLLDSNLQLTKARDHLLPRLMNGEMAV